MPPPPDQLEEISSSSDEAPPPLSQPNEVSSSSSDKTKPPPLSQPSEQSSSSEPESSYESSSSQTITQSSSSSIAGSNSSSSQSEQNSSNSSQDGQSSSSLKQANNEPRLEGKCVWDKNPTTQARGAVPSGVTLVDNDKMCGNTKPPVVYKYKEGTQTWPSGSLSANTYTDVQATVNCSGYDVAPVTCPALVANAGSDHVIDLDCSNAGTAGPTLDKCKGTNSSTLKVDECVDITVSNYTAEAAYPGSAIIACQVDRKGQNVDGSATLTINGKTYNGMDYIQIDLGVKYHSGDNEFGTLCLTKGGPEVKCQIERR